MVQVKVTLKSGVAVFAAPDDWVGRVAVTNTDVRVPTLDGERVFSKTDVLTVEAVAVARVDDPPRARHGSARPRAQRKRAPRKMGRVAWLELQVATCEGDLREALGLVPQPDYPAVPSVAVSLRCRDSYQAELDRLLDQLARLKAGPPPMPWHGACGCTSLASCPHPKFPAYAAGNPDSSRR